MKNILKHLQHLNFSQYESKAYVSLLKQGHVTGYELAKNSGIPASKIYSVLNKLLEKEIILAHDSDPVKYTPISPDKIINRFRSEYQHTFDALGPSLSEIYKQDQNSDHYIWNIIGREEIIERIITFIDHAQKSIYLSVWDEEVTGIKDALYRAGERGIVMSIVHYGEIRLGIGQEYRHGREHIIRQQRGARRIALTVDEEKVILAHFLDNGVSNALWSINKGLVLLTKDYIIHDIYTIRMAEKFGAAAIEIFESH
ncbi:MAG: TrmB family transcriptional regulator [Calditrichales bacterium]|nr:MAG: TrmB family transcriptional regulator [Calditrichales bacterium]